MGGIPGDIPLLNHNSNERRTGWGQWERNRRGKALGFAASFGILTAGALSLRTSYTNRARARGDLNNPFAGALILPAENFTGAGTESALAYASIFQTEQNRVDAAFRRSRNANLLLVLVYLAKLVHAARVPKANLTPGERPGPIFSVSTSRIDTLAAEEGRAGEQLEFPGWRASEENRHEQYYEILDTLLFRRGDARRHDPRSHRNF